MHSESSPPPTSSELMGALGALTGAGPANPVGDTTERRIQPLRLPGADSPYNLPFFSVDSVDIDPAPSPFKPYELDPESIRALAACGMVGLRRLGTNDLVNNTLGNTFARRKVLINPMMEVHMTYKK